MYFELKILIARHQLKYTCIHKGTLSSYEKAIKNTTKKRVRRVKKKDLSVGKWFDISHVTNNYSFFKISYIEQIHWKNFILLKQSEIWMRNCIRAINPIV